MKTALVVAVVFGAALLAGCKNSKEDELQQQLSQAQNEQASLQQSIAERDKYFEEVMRTVNDVYADLERARTAESQISQKAGGEGTVQFTNAEARDKMLQNITDIGAALKSNRKRIIDLQRGARKFRGDIAGLDTLIRSLRVTVEEREQAIAQLQARVQGLETTVAEKNQAIATRDSMIDVQQRDINTAYYVVGTRDELKKKGIITDEGGFLWGLLGSTTVMAPGADPSEFTAIDRTKDETIRVDGTIEDILPRRTEDSYAMAKPNDKSAEITILTPNKFWHDRYLVIVKD
jgi:uncharacterized protein YlxW (UPF0749 family)